MVVFYEPKKFYIMNKIKTIVVFYKKLVVLFHNKKNLQLNFMRKKHKWAKQSKFLLAVYIRQHLIAVVYWWHINYIQTALKPLKKSEKIKKKFHGSF